MLSSLTVPRSQEAVAVATATMFAIVAMLVPTVALAQSAGDEQYSDPLQNTPSGANTKSGSTNNGSTNNGSTNSAPQATQGTTTQPQTQTPDAGTSQVTPQAGTVQTGPQLPRTGLDVGLLALMGGASLASGFVLRRVLAHA